MKKLLLSVILLTSAYMSVSYGQTAFSYTTVDIFANKVSSAVDGIIEGVFLEEDGAEYMIITLDQSTPFIHISRGVDSVDSNYRDVTQIRSWSRDHDGSVNAYYVVGSALVLTSFIDMPEYGFKLLYITYERVEE